MKKFLFVSLFVISFALVSCSGSDTIPSGGFGNNYDNTDPSYCIHDWEDATCTTARTCIKCQTTQGEALGHTTSKGKCDRCGESFSSWSIGEYVDEFNRPIGKKYIYTSSVSGVFSNSATTNSRLLAGVQINADDIGIMLLEYGSSQVKGIFDYEDYQITILDESGNKHYFSGTLYEGGTRIYFKSSDRSKIVNLLKSNDSLEFYLKSSKYSISTYLFEIENSGFYNLYQQL